MDKIKISVKYSDGKVIPPDKLQLEIIKKYNDRIEKEDEIILVKTKEGTLIKWRE